MKRQHFWLRQNQRVAPTGRSDTMSELTKLVSLSLPLDQLMGYRQMRKTATVPQFIRNIFFQGHRVCFSPHTATHTDFPWSIPNWKIPKITSYLASVKLQKRIPEEQSKIDDWLDRALSPRKIHGYILNLTFLKERIDSFIEKDPLWETQADHLRWNLTGDEFADLYESLHINRQLLKERLDDEDIANKLIVLRSGWLENFYVKNQEYWDPINDCFRTYLCHPYLTDEDILWLINRDIAGLAIDFPSPDEPLYYVGRETKFPYLRNLVETQPRLSASLRTVHVCLLSQGMLLIENLANLGMLQDDSQMLTETEIHLFPLELRLLDAGVLQVFGTRD